MKVHSLFPGAAPSTNLGFGTTSLMGLSTTGERLALLEAAFDAGIRHFDTAPYYGYGEAERLLGDFMAGKRDQLTVTTKYGIQPPSVIKSRWVNLLARRILRLVPSLKTKLSRKAQSLTQKHPFTAAAARRSLDQSLAALKTDHVDLFLLHEPTFADAESGQLHQFLEEEVKRGKIRAFGCGGECGVIRQVAAARLPTARWLQFEDHILSRRIEEIRATGARCITFRTFHRALNDLAGWLQANDGERVEWERTLQLSLQAEGNLAGLLQAVSHARNPEGIVLFSTRHAGRIRAAAAIAAGNRFSVAQVELFNKLAGNISVHAESAMLQP